MGYQAWKPYVPVAERRNQAAKIAQKAKETGQAFAPVVIASRVIAQTFWGKAWCDNLESYSDYESRLPRGRTYVRNGSVIDLQIQPGRLVAKVLGSELYQVEIGIEPLSANDWKKLVSDCTGSVVTLVELLQGKLSQAVMARLCQPQVGLFPSPREIRLECSCPDWAGMCKHVAAVLYGVGARLDEQPELLFSLRQVDPDDLLAAQAAEFPTLVKTPSKAKVLDDAALADVFGIEMAMPAVNAPETTKEKAPGKRASPKAPRITANSSTATQR